jgi:anti-sigma factor RsiW
MRWELLDRYQFGQCNAAERAEVEQWLAESPARRELLEQLTAPDEPGSPAPHARKAAAWDRLERELHPGRKLGGDD